MSGGEPGRLVASRAFSIGEQDRFARVSADYNEIHTDAVAARKSLAGRQVVHGLHAVLWAVDAYLAQRPLAIDRFTASFRKPIFLDEAVRVEIVEEQDEVARLQIAVEETTVFDLELGLAASVPPALDDRVSLNLPRVPRELSMADLDGLGGSEKVPHDHGELERLFPSLVEAMGAGYAAHLAAISRLVGMICPGRYSMLSGLDVAVSPDGSSAAFDWTVTRVDDRVGAVSMAISGGLVGGTVDAFLVQKPTRQADFAELSSLVVPGEFAGQRALVVGGSRGIGEVTAKLISAGGGDTVITWKVGSSDADRVAEEITSSGGRAAAVRFDVSDPDSLRSALDTKGWLPSHVYYFASPKIFVRRTRLLDPGLLANYVDVYVSGFVNVVETCRLAGSKEIVAFYPSSVAVEEDLAALTEYAAAKAAGEVAARSLASNNGWLRVVIERLPRIQTDQTASILPVPAADPAPIMLGIVRRMTVLE